MIQLIKQSDRRHVETSSETRIACMRSLEKKYASSNGVDRICKTVLEIINNLDIGSIRNQLQRYELSKFYESGTRLYFANRRFLVQADRS